MRSSPTLSYACDTQSWHASPFIIVSLPAEIIALFAKNAGWKPIPHSDTADFDMLNQSTKDTEASK